MFSALLGRTSSYFSSQSSLGLWKTESIAQTTTKTKNSRNLHGERGTFEEQIQRRNGHSRSVIRKTNFGRLKHRRLWASQWNSGWTHRKRKNQWVRNDSSEPPRSNKPRKVNYSWRTTSYPWRRRIDATPKESPWKPQHGEWKWSCLNWREKEITKAPQSTTDWKPSKNS